VPTTGQLAVKEACKIFLSDGLAMPVDKAIDILNRERLFRMSCEQNEEPYDALMAQRPTWPEVVQAVFTLRGVNPVVIRTFTITDFSHVFVNFELPPILEFDLALMPRVSMLN
jgi:hypothetical protein